MNEFINGNCIEYMGTMKDKSVDLICTDPPYLMQYKTGRRNNKANKFDIDQRDKMHKFATTIVGDDDEELIRHYINESYRILKDDRAMYMFCTSSTYSIFENHILSAGFDIKNVIVWVKSNHTAGDLYGAFGKKHEFIILASKGSAKYNGKRINDVWEFKTVSGNSQEHQNQKPLDLISQCIEKHSNVGDVVFDGFAGSGTTLVAARNLNRNYIGVEIDEEYYSVAERRLTKGSTGILQF